MALATNYASLQAVAAAGTAGAADTQFDRRCATRSGSPSWTWTFAWVAGADQARRLPAPANMRRCRTISRG